MNSIALNCLANIGYGKMILGDIDDATFCEKPNGLNHPAWLLIHLATGADYAASLLGGKSVCPAEWNELGDTKKPQSTNRADYPSKEVLVNAFVQAHEQAAKLLSEAAPEKLQEKQTLGFFEKELPTIGDIVAFLILTHTAIHLGQISAWRRAMGKPALF